MEVTHPRAGDGPGVPPAQVDVDGENVTVDDDGVFEAPEGWVQRFADRHDADVEQLRVGDTDEEPDDAVEADDPGSDGATAEKLEADDAEPGDTICSCDAGEACDACGGLCPTVKSDGDVCGRDRPCSYHDNDEQED